MPTKKVKSAQHKNFYETIQEAEMRLLGTVVMYDEKPYYILAVTKHKPDGIFRVYMDDLTNEKGPAHKRVAGIPYNHYDAENHSSVGHAMDAWLETEAGKKSGIVRKMANSPKFNKYRPFPLGMVNLPNGHGTLYCRRTPNNRTHQGLTQSMVVQTPVSLDGAKHALRAESFTSVAFAEMLVNEYPSFDEVYTNLKDPEVANNVYAFHRDFAVLRGPLKLLFLAYKDDVVGLLSGSDGKTLRLASEFGYTKEVIEELGIFTSITVE